MTATWYGLWHPAVGEDPELEDLDCVRERQAPAGALSMEAIAIIDIVLLAAVEGGCVSCFDRQSRGVSQGSSFNFEM